MAIIRSQNYFITSVWCIVTTIYISAVVLADILLGGWTADQVNCIKHATTLCLQVMYQYLHQCQGTLVGHTSSWPYALGKFDRPSWVAWRLLAASSEQHCPRTFVNMASMPPTHPSHSPQLKTRITILTTTTTKNSQTNSMPLATSILYVRGHDLF